MQSRSLFLLLIATLLSSLPASVDAQGGRVADRLRLSGWAGGFTSAGGFSQDGTFYSFREQSGLFDDYAFGGSLQYGFPGGLLVGVEGLYSAPNFTSFEQDTGIQTGSGEASLFGAMASASLTGSQGGLGFVLTGGAGYFFWDIDELGGRNSDLALDFGIGVDLRLLRQLVLFGDYSWWWVYHEKGDEDIASNTARFNLLRAGLRFVIL